MPVRKSRIRKSRCRHGRKKSMRKGCKSRPGPKRKSSRKVRRSRRQNVKKYNYQLSGAQKRKRSKIRSKAATKIQSLQRKRRAKSRVNTRRLLAHTPENVYSTQDAEPSYIWSRVTPYVTKYIEDSHTLPEDWELDDLNYKPSLLEKIFQITKQLTARCRINWIDNPQPPHPMIEKMFNTDSFFIDRSHAGGIMDIRPKQSIIEKWGNDGELLVYELMNNDSRYQKINMTNFIYKFNNLMYQELYDELSTYDFQDKIMTLSLSQLQIYSIDVPLPITNPLWNEAWYKQMIVSDIKVQWAEKDNFYKIFPYGYNILLPIWEISFGKGEKYNTMVIDLTNHINQYFEENGQNDNAKYILNVSFSSKLRDNGHAMLIAIEDGKVYGCDPNGFVETTDTYLYSEQLRQLMQTIASKCYFEYGGMLEDLNPGCHNTSKFQLDGLVCQSWTNYLALLIAINPSVKVPAIFDYHAVKGYSREYLFQRAVFIVMYLFERFSEFIRDKLEDDRFFEII